MERLVQPEEVRVPIVEEAPAAEKAPFRGKRSRLSAVLRVTKGRNASRAIAPPQTSSRITSLRLVTRPMVMPVMAERSAFQRGILPLPSELMVR